MTAPSTDPKRWNVGLVGYGEVGRILAEDLRQRDVRVAAYDIKLRSDQAGGALRDHAARHSVALTASHADLAAQSDFIVSAVTASQALRSRRHARKPSNKAPGFSISIRPRPAPSSAQPR
jgi:phosphoglycerate dehydrogenase-like enzyme